MEISQIKKGLIDYILDNIYDLNYCREIFLCDDKFELIRYIEPLWKIKKSKYNYNKYFNDFPLDICYFTLLFDTDTEKERIIKTKSHIILNRIKELCCYYSLRYGFDVYSLYKFMDNNKYEEINSDDDEIEEDISENDSLDGFKKLTDFNDNLRVIITPIFSPRKKQLIKGDYIILDNYKEKRNIPNISYKFPVNFMKKELLLKKNDQLKYFTKLEFPINISEKIADNIYIDKTSKNIVLINLSVEDIYRYLYFDYICYRLGLSHYNGYCLSSPTDNFLLFDDSILNMLQNRDNSEKNTEESVELDELIKLNIVNKTCNSSRPEQNGFHIGKYNNDYDKYSLNEILILLERKFIERKNI